MSGIISGSSTQSSGGVGGGTTDSDQRRPSRGRRGGGGGGVRGLSKDQGHYIDPRLQDELAERIWQRHAAIFVVIFLFAIILAVVMIIIYGGIQPDGLVLSVHKITIDTTNNSGAILLFFLFVWFIKAIVPILWYIFCRMRKIFCFTQIGALGASKCWKRLGTAWKPKLHFWIDGI